MTITYEIQDCVLADRFTAVCRGEVPVGDLRAWLAESFHAVEGYLSRTSAVVTGPPFARLAFLDGVVVVEAGFPVRHEIAGAYPVQPSTLPDGPAAITTHIGRYEDLDMAYGAIRAWLDAHRYAASGPHWEIYHEDPDTEPDTGRWRTDVIQPYRTTPQT